MRLTTLLSIIIILTGITSYGQYGMPINSMIHTPIGNVPYTYYVPSPRMFYGQPNVSVKHKFDIVLKNDSAFSTRTKITFAEKENHSIVVKNGKIKRTFIPSDTKSISRKTYEGDRLIGIPADTCWLFKTYIGKINGYSFLAEPGLLYAIAIQRGDEGPIVPLTKENLLFIVGSDRPKIIKMIEKDQLIEAIEAYNTW